MECGFNCFDIKPSKMKLVNLRFKTSIDTSGQTSKSYMLEAHWDHCVPLDVYAQNIAQEKDMHSA